MTNPSKDLRCAICTKTWDEHKTVISHNFKHDPRPRYTCLVEGCPSNHVSKHEVCKVSSKTVTAVEAFKVLVEEIDATGVYLDGPKDAVKFIAACVSSALTKLIQREGSADETSGELGITRNALGNLVAAFVNTQGGDHINADIAFALREARQVLGGPYLPVEPSGPPLYRHDWETLPGPSYRCKRCKTTCLDAHDALLCAVRPVKSKPRLRDSDAAFNLGVLPTEQPEKATEQLLADRDRLREVNKIALDKAQEALEGRSVEMDAAEKSALYGNIDQLTRKE